ncbi:MAG: serine/threonine protein kinase [Labilithrix sp.]|nr:serine/threonine protein kinase [Labilithrix sp.]
MEIVALEAAPAEAGQHLLELEIPGEDPILLLADPAGREEAGGFPLHVRPVTRPQMAAILALVERLDEPSKTVPPSGDDPAAVPFDLETDGTIVDPMSLVPGAVSEMPVALRFGAIASVAPVSLPPSSEPPLSVAPISSSVPQSAAPYTPSRSGPVARPEGGSDLTGRLIAGKYRIESTIGSGAAAAVFRATHEDLKRPVAVKILHAQNRGEMQFVRRFTAEARAASKLEHLNVTRVIDFGQEKDGLLYLVMELLMGQSLEAILASEGKLRPRKALELAMQVCSALAFAHDEGIFHRDIKPENIVLIPHRDDDGNPYDLVKVCDFGLAKLRDPDPDQGELTLGGMLCGSPAYMSPEQARGESLDARTDLYSLGVTLFECLTGAFPHAAESLAELFVKKTLEPPRRPSELLPDIDPVVEDVVMKAIATDPVRRHANARVLREELRTALASLDEISGEDDREGTIIAG